MIAANVVGAIAGAAISNAVLALLGAFSMAPTMECGADEGKYRWNRRMMALVDSKMASNAAT